MCVCVCVCVSRSRFMENKPILSQFTKNKIGILHFTENNKDNENQGSRQIKHLFLILRKMILQNHASPLLWKSRCMKNKLVISHFTGKKRADHKS